MSKFSVEQDTGPQRDFGFAEGSNPENKLALLGLVDRPGNPSQDSALRDRPLLRAKSGDQSVMDKTGLRYVVAQQSFHEQMDELEKEYREGGVRKNPTRMIELSKAVLQRSDDEFLQTWHKLKPEFEKIAPAIEAVVSERSALLAEGNSIAQGLPEEEKKSALKALQLMKDMQEFKSGDRHAAIAKMRENPSLKDIAASFARIEDEYVVALSTFERMVGPLKGALLNMHFAQLIARSVFLHTDTIDKETEFEERKRLTIGSMGIPVSELLKHSEPYLQDRYEPGSLPVKFWKVQK